MMQVIYSDSFFHMLSVGNCRQQVTPEEYNANTSAHSAHLVQNFSIPKIKLT